MDRNACVRFSMNTAKATAGVEDTERGMEIRETQDGKDYKIIRKENARFSV